MRAVPLVAVHAIRARRRGRALLALPVAVSWAVLAAGRSGRLGKFCASSRRRGLRRGCLVGWTGLGRYQRAPAIPAVMLAVNAVAY